MPTDQVEVVPALWGVADDPECLYWPGPLYKVNPAPEIWAPHGAIGR